MPGCGALSPSETIPWIVTGAPAAAFPSFSTRSRQEHTRDQGVLDVQGEPGAISERAARLLVRPVDAR
jgi:hypothetical protein